MTALDARNLSYYNSTDVRKEIYDFIKKCALTGHTRATWGKSIPVDVLSLLREEGYEVTKYPSDQETIYMIDWAVGGSVTPKLN